MFLLRRPLRHTAPLLSGLSLGACSLVGLRGGTPQPPYTVLAVVTPQRIEIRQYGARVAAESVETGDELAARNTGFRRLAGFIFGGNDRRQRISMTAPVSQDPVAAEPAGAGRWRIRFFLPDTLRAGDVPVPHDPQVRIVPVPAQTVAVLRFSGIPGVAAVAERKQALLAALEQTHWRGTGPPVAWFYDPPWTLPPLRRNEVVVPVSPRG